MLLIRTFELYNGDRPIIFIAHSLGGLVAARIHLQGERRDPGSFAKSITKSLRE
ncbi:hypothetical protein F4802DRAFT_560402 [Xylaria palmicola]|nr:hypothetical protein F4802DRAFT_560402 [Xylaria palmicola]